MTPHDTPCTRWFESSKPAEIAANQAFAVHSTDVPVGWERLLLQTMRQLVQVRTVGRQFALSCMTVSFDGEVLDVDIPWSDEVLMGITRRCAEQSRFICRHCGKRGLLRRFGMHDAAVLCAQCAAPELLHCAIDDAVRYPGLMTIGGCVNDLRRVPEVLRRTFIRASRSGGAADTDTEPRMAAPDFRRWVANLQRLQTRLPPPTCFNALK